MSFQPISWFSFSLLYRIISSIFDSLSPYIFSHIYLEHPRHHTHHIDWTLSMSWMNPSIYRIYEPLPLECLYFPNLELAYLLQILNLRWNILNIPRRNLLHQDLLVGSSRQMEVKSHISFSFPHHLKFHKLFELITSALYHLRLVLFRACQDDILKMSF